VRTQALAVGCTTLSGIHGGDAAEAFVAAVGGVSGSPTRMRDLERAASQQGDQIRVTAALDAVGELAAFTELHVSPRRGTVARTADTAVAPAHRRRGLGMWVKAESLRLLAVQRPDIELVTTSSSADNVTMLEVNRRLGFQPVAIWTGAVLTLAPPPGP
jgi:GNAT superfamily N-acetyltransferase